MKFALAAVFALLFLQHALAYPAPLPGTEPIPQLMEKADLVCKGLVISAPPTIVGDNYQEKTGVAQVRVDRCFKGDPESGEIPVLFNWIVPAAGAPVVVLKTGDYFLFFLKRQSNGRYLPFDDFFSTLHISRLVGDAPREADSMQLLELDLEAGLKDTDQELMLDSIRMLGNMRHLRSTRELKDLEQNPDLLVRTYVWQALMRLADYSVLPSVVEFFQNQPEANRSLRLPEDRLLWMQSELAREIGQVKDPAHLPELHQLMEGRNRWARQESLQAVRAIRSKESGPYLYKMLDDSDVSNRFGAMQGLLALRVSGDRTWVPSWAEFDKNPDFYVSKCREWWNSEGKALARPISQISERERNGFRGLVKSCIEERTYPKSVVPEREAKYWQKTEYDLEGRVVETRFRNPDGRYWVSRRSYNASGRPLKTSSGMEDGPTAETLYSYDDQGKLLRITNSGSSENPVTFRYDEHGRKTKIQTSRAEDYRPNVAVAGSPFESGDMPPNLPGGGTATTIHDDQDRPVEVQIRDSHGDVVSRATRSYDDQGRIVEEKQILDTPETIIPAEMRTKILEQSGTSMEELREQLTKVMGGQAGPYSVRYTYDERGQIKQTLRRIFNREQDVETSYTEHGDVSGEITREKQIGGETESDDPSPRPPSYSEVRYAYEYDVHDNWTRQTLSYRSSADGAFESSTETRRTLSYY